MTCSTRATPITISALVRAFERIGSEGRGPLRGYEILDSGDRLRVRLALTAVIRRRACRKAKELFSSAWYDAFGEHQTVGQLHAIEVRDEDRGARAVEPRGFNRRRVDAA